MDKAKQILLRLTNKIAAENDYKDCKVSIHPTYTEGANFTTQLCLITISASGKEDIELFGKVAIIGEHMRDQFSAERLYKTEAWFYSDLLKKFTDMQDKHQVPDSDRLHVPKYYGSNEEAFEETMILENLSAKSFTTCDRFTVVDWEYASKAVEQLAKLHSLSIAYGEKNPAEYQEMIKSDDLKYGMMGLDLEALDKNMQFLWYKNISNAINIVNEDNRERVKTFAENVTPSYVHQFYKPSRCTVIAHGDFKSTNLMHKMDNDGNLQVVIIDYQTLQASNPIMDLMHFIFTCSDEEFRSKHYERLLEHYYTELSLALQRLHVDADEVYPKTDFEQDLKEMLPFGLCIGLFTLQIILVDNTEGAPTLEKELPKTGIKASPLYTERLNGIVNDYIKWGVI